MKKHNIYLGLFFSMVCSVFLFLPSGVSAAFLFPNANSCVSVDDLPGEDINYYFVVTDSKDSSTPADDTYTGVYRPPIMPLTPTGDVDFSTKSTIKCFKMSPNIIRDVLVSKLFDIGFFPNEYQSYFLQNKVSLSEMYSLVMTSSDDVTKFNSGKGQGGPMILGLNPVRMKEASEGLVCTTPLVSSGGDRVGPCKLVYNLAVDGRTMQLYYLFGKEGDEITANFEWSGNHVTLAKGQKQSFEVSVLSNLSGLPDISISCQNCQNNGITVTEGSTRQSIFLTIDGPKLKDQKIVLKAKTIGPVSFVSEHEILISITDVDCTSLSQNECTNNVECWWYPGYSAANKCIAKTLNIECVNVPKELCGTKNGSSYCVYIDKAGGGTCTDYLSAPSQSSYDVPGSDTYFGPLPPCAFDGSCRNVNDLIQLFINFGKMTLGIVGSAALVFFVYGGVMMILSMGNSERVKKGKDILVASIIGIVIAFSAYALINFVLDVLNVSKDFRVIEETK